MYRILFLLFALGTLSFVMFSYSSGSGDSARFVIDVNQLSVEQALEQLGEEKYLHSMPKWDEQKAKMGEDLIHYGKTTKDGKKTKRISRYFVCTDCHNIGKEFKPGSDQSAEARLKYAKENGMPFLPGSTFYGMYNRTSFYNDDYVKKYGDLVIDSRDSLGNAIQLCSKYCSSGRPLEDWELDAMMHYFKKNELHIGDLDLSENDQKNLMKYAKLKDDEKKALAERIKKQYHQAYSAKFLETMPRNERKYGEGGDPVNGKLIYEKSCMYCHGNGRVTYLSLDKTKLTARMFWRKRKGYSDQSIYQIVRHGTYSKAGRKQYMPLYTEEKMSNEQLNDLVAYIKQLAGK